jgi:hypothetical protein
MHPDFLKIPQEQVLATLAQKDLKEFIKLFWSITEPSTPFIDGWHISALTDHLQNLSQIRNLLINCPPGTSKSVILCVYFCAWTWASDPSRRFLYASHDLALAKRDSLTCRRLVESPSYQAVFPHVAISDDQNTKEKFSTTAYGYRQCISVASGTTGNKANYCIIDDPHDATDANSPIRMQEALGWFADSWYSRLIDFNTDCRIVIGQRIAKGDLSNFILENYGETFTHLCLPWEYRPTPYVSVTGWKDPRTEVGEPLWPQRFSEQDIRNLKRRAASFSAQWNQNPTDAEHAVFRAEDWRYYQETPDTYEIKDRTIAKDNCLRIMSVDPAMSEGARADYTAIVVADIDPYGFVFLVHCYRERINSVKVVPKIQDLWLHWNPRLVLVEDHSFGKMIADQCKAARLPVRAVRTIKKASDAGDIKFIRSLDLQLAFENHEVWFPLSKPAWLPILETELLEFPGPHDDLIDACSYLVTEARKRLRRGRTPAEVKPVEETPEERAAREAKEYNAAVLEGLFIPDKVCYKPAPAPQWKLWR